IALERPFGHPHTRHLEDRAVLTGDLDVARDAVGRGVQTLRAREGDAVLFVEKRGRPLSRERELRALQLEDRVSDAVQLRLRTGTASSRLGRQDRPECDRDERRRRYCFFLAVHSIVPMPGISALPFAIVSPSMSPVMMMGTVPFGVAKSNVTF